MSDRIRVAVCACTCRRPHGLARLLRGLARQRFRDGRPPHVRVHVADNCGGLTPAGEVAGHAARVPWPVNFVEAVEGNIPYCRNRVLEEVAPETDFVAMIDDDELPARDWLSSHLDAARTYGADVVFGPVVPSFGAGVPDWVRRGGFFRPKQMDGGTRVGSGATNNVLIRFSLLAELDCWFDEGFGAAGGSDHEFFRRLAARGYRLVWCDRARVFEVVPSERSTVGYLLRRSFRRGATAGFVDRLHNSRAGSRARHLLRAAAKAVGWPAYMLFRTLRDGVAGLVRGLEVGASGAGFLVGALGYGWEMYSTPGGLVRIRLDCVEG